MYRPSERELENCLFHPLTQSRTNRCDFIVARAELPRRDVTSNHGSRTRANSRAALWGRASVTRHVSCGKSQIEVRPSHLAPSAARQPRARSPPCCAIARNAEIFAHHQTKRNEAEKKKRASRTVRGPRRCPHDARNQVITKPRMGISRVLLGFW